MINIDDMFGIDIFDPNQIFNPLRYGKITGSSCSVLFPTRSAEVGQTQYAKQLANEMYFKYYDINNTWQTEHGTLSEEFAFDYFQKYYDKSAVYKPEFKCKDDFFADADCICDGYGVDFKCPTSVQAWLDYIHKGISKEQFHQAQMYMMMYDLNKWVIAAYLLETAKMSDKGKQYPVDFDKRMILVEVERLDGWEDTLRKNAEFVIKKRDEFYQNLIKQFGTK